MQIWYTSVQEATYPVVCERYRTCMLQGFLIISCLILAKKDCRDSTKKHKIHYSSDYFASHKLPLQPNTVQFYTIGIV